MEKRKALRVALMIVLAAATAVPCSWDTTPAFAFRVRPDDPIDQYIDGRIGIIRPEFARSHLVVAYRYLSGNPPSDKEREGFTALIDHRLTGNWNIDDGTKTWAAAQAEIRGVKPASGPYPWRNAGPYSHFTNCTHDAFVRAAVVLRDRATRFGATSPAVASWLEAQETVFANCSEGEAIPKPADASLPPLIRADRAYQIAAAHFYATKYDTARAQFLAIANDGDSPWRQTARLVAARALLRKSTVETPARGDDTFAFLVEPMQQAERDLRAILADTAMASQHASARNLLAFARFRLEPAARFRESALALLRGSTSATRDLDDYTLLYDRDQQSDDDLTNWIRTFQSGADAVAKWRTSKKPHWLVAALAHTKPEDSAELLEASKDIGADSAAYPSVAHHRVRLLLASNKPDDARTELDRVLSLGEEKLPPSSRNLLLEQRRGLARSIVEFVRDARNTPVGMEADQYPDQFNFPLLPPDAADVLSEQTPLDVIAEAAMTKDLEPSIRNPILVAAWTRAILLDREDVAARLAPEVIALVPNVEPRFNTWRKSTQRRLAAADLIVHFGALQPDVLWYGGRLANERDFESVSHAGGNWWCGARASEARPVPPFLSEHAGQAATERLALLELGSGTTFLLRTFIDAANEQPKDPRVAEGLALAIQGTRWSCGDSATDDLARQAFNVLHKRYAGTKWAKETPYWYRSGF